MKLEVKDVPLGDVSLINFSKVPLLLHPPGQKSFLKQSWIYKELIFHQNQGLGGN